MAYFGILIRSKIVSLFQSQEVRCYSTVFHFGNKKRWEPEEKKTHTGQEWSKGDYRLVRFVDRPKQINTRFAIDLIQEIPPKPADARVTWCDGGGGPLGHPKVYINLDQPGNHSCGYCGLRFYLDKECTN
ncbi:NADH dehydrogenase [ubiquinone] iron-sulfur protein 6, mitochondrial-like isoform X1 [Limulus polyphemus]|uniref:NADH dehydrogenase [ubiquinone] iron-sulfur protein 6, mitochondrial-like isoform X1 n=1 Tax=Limulus polyphemus TaxID=6850 RepID=A0ABM1BFY3_LIMPO|nr:NADH dehydrogenase [ubiquinone] iron-sulfur protein 6, mitochondrial-like isoform X1 [Limulus polyphemus]